MADTHKDLDYLRFFHASESSLKDKDVLKNQAFSQYQNRVLTLCALPACLQTAHIFFLNRPQFLATCSYVRQLKALAFIGSFSMVWYERTQLEKKWSYYDKLYPEPTQLQKSLVTEAEVYQVRDKLGIKEKTLAEKSVLDPETRRTYSQLYQLPPLRTAEPDYDPNAPSIKTHYGKS